MIITLGTSKGGSGKSTLAANLAAYWAGEGHSVALCDADPNGSLLQWQRLHEADPSAQRPGVARPKVYALNEELIPKLRTDLEAQVDVVVVDSAGAFGTVEQSIYMMSDFIVIPVRPSAMDIAEATKTMKRLQGVRAQLAGMGHTRIPKAAYVVNGVRPGESASAQSGDVLGSLGALLDSQVGLRSAFVSVMAQGVGVSTFEGRRDTKAVAEIAALADELVAVLNGTKEISNAA